MPETLEDQITAETPIEEAPAAPVDALEAYSDAYEIESEGLNQEGEIVIVIDVAGYKVGLQKTGGTREEILANAKRVAKEVRKNRNL